LFDAGYFFIKSAGRTGRGTKLPPQLGQTPFSFSVTQFWQKVHSKEQIIASLDSGGKSLSQHSQFGLISSIFTPPQIVNINRNHIRNTAIKLMVKTAPRNLILSVKICTKECRMRPPRKTTANRN